MAIRADQRYNGTVTGGTWIETQKGSVGFQVGLDCPEGQTSYTIWLTDNPKAKESARKAFGTLGVKPEQINDAAYLEHQMPQDIVGVEVAFGTAEDTYQGKTSIKVRWIGKPSAAGDKPPAAFAASYFGGKGESSGASVATIEDDDLPGSVPF